MDNKSNKLEIYKNKQENNDAFEEKLDQISTSYAEEEVEHSGSHLKLYSGEGKIGHLKRKFKEQIKMTEHREHLRKAINAIQASGRENLADKKKWEILEKELTEAARLISNITPDTDLTERPFMFLGISNESMQSINLICKEKYRNNDLESVIDICTLLTTLDPLDPSYWLQLGIAFQEKENYSKAIEAYSVCHLLDSTIIPSWLFSAECYIKENMPDDASVELQEGKKLIQLENSGNEWNEMVNFLEDSLKKAS